jgi:hypothetical protein
MYPECIQLELKLKDHWDLAVMLSIELVLLDRIPMAVGSTEPQTLGVLDHILSCIINSRP